jgi:hypothetical protein
VVVLNCVSLDSKTKPKPKSDSKQKPTDIDVLCVKQHQMAAAAAAASSSDLASGVKRKREDGKHEDGQDKEAQIKDIAKYIIILMDYGPYRQEILGKKCKKRRCKNLRKLEADAARRVMVPLLEKGYQCDPFDRVFPGNRKDKSKLCNGEEKCLCLDHGITAELYSYTTKVDRLTGINMVYDSHKSRCVYGDDGRAGNCGLFLFELSGRETTVEAGAAVAAVLDDTNQNESQAESKPKQARLAV